MVCNGIKLEPVLYTKQIEDENIAHIFIDRLQNDIEQVWASEVKQMTMTGKCRLDFKLATESWICK